MSQTLKYFYCDGYTQKSVNVTLSNETSACANMTEYDDGYNIYRTYTKTLTFTLSSAIAVPLTVRYSYYYVQEIDYEQTYAGTLDSSVTIPAGQTVKNLTVTCKEERWVHTDTNGNYLPAQV